MEETEVKEEEKKSGDVSPDKSEKERKNRRLLLTSLSVFIAFVVGFSIGSVSTARQYEDSKAEQERISKITKSEPSKAAPSPSSDAKKQDGAKDAAKKSDSVKKESPAKKDAVPTEHRNALKSAQVYSDKMHMSKARLYDQLTSEHGEKFSAEAAQYAIDNVKADWNKNALETAKSYRDTMSMSPSRIYDQLVSEHGEKFTPEEAQYAVDHLGD